MLGSDIFHSIEINTIKERLIRKESNICFKKPKNVWKCHAFTATRAFNSLSNNNYEQWNLNFTL